MAEAEEAEKAAAARAEKVAARRAALGELVLELVAAERVSAVEAKATTAKVPAAASALRNRPTKVLKRELIAGGARCVVGAAHRGGAPQAGERGALRAGADEGGAGDGGDSPENKAERRREAEWAKEQEDQRAPKERACEEEEADALHERLRRETQFAQHCVSKVNPTNGAQSRRQPLAGVSGGRGRVRAADVLQLQGHQEAHDLAPPH
jgi:hypothetical protein